MTVLLEYFDVFHADIVMLNTINFRTCKPINQHLQINPLLLWDVHRSIVTIARSTIKLKGRLLSSEKYRILYWWGLFYGTE